MLGNLLQTRSVFLLDETAKSLLKRWEVDLLDPNAAHKVSHDDLIQAFHDRVALSELLKVLEQDLAGVNAALFPYLLPHQKERIRHQLVRAHYLHAVQCRIDEIEFRRDGVKKNRAKCNDCKRLLHDLNDARGVGVKPTPAAQLNTASSLSEKPLTYFGMTIIAPIFAKQLLDFCSGKLNFIQSRLTEIDRKGLYLGWSRHLLLGVMAMLPATMVRQHNAGLELQESGTYLSYMGIFVSQMCMMIELALLTKNSLAGAWVTRNDPNPISPWEQFTIQVEQRKFVLLNGLLLSTANTISFLWLTGLLQGGPYGVFIGVGFRIYQLGVLTMRYDHEQTQHHRKMEQIRKEVGLLEQEVRSLRIQLKRATNEPEKAALLAQLNLLQEDIGSHSRARRQGLTEQGFQDAEYQQQILFTLGLLAGVSLVACVVFPPAGMVPAAGLIIGLVGAAVCFSSILVFSAANGSVQSARIEEKENEIREQCTTHMEAFRQLKRQKSDPLMDTKMKQLYLQMKDLACQSDYQKRLLQHQQVEVMVKVFRDAFLPVVTLASFILLPTGLGLGFFGVIAGAALVGFCVNQYFQRYAPEAPPKSIFDEQAYADFVRDPHLKKLLEQGTSQSYRERLVDAKTHTKLESDHVKDEVIGGDLEAGM